MEKDLWFKRTEFDGRLSQVQRELGDRGLGGALVFQPETITWLTGFFTAGHGYFELAIVPPAGPPVLVCRDVSRYYADRTCAWDEKAYWSDGDDILAVAVGAIRAALGEPHEVGIDLDAWPLSASIFGDLRIKLPRARLTDIGSFLARLDSSSPRPRSNINAGRRGLPRLEWRRDLLRHDRAQVSGTLRQPFVRRWSVPGVTRPDRASYRLASVHAICMAAPRIES